MTLDGEQDPRHSLGDLEPGLRHRLAVLDEPVGWADWSAVARRHGTHVAGRLSLIFAAVLVVAGAAAGGVWIVAGHSNGTGAAGSTDAFQRFSLGTPPIASHAIASETRVITSAHVQGSERTLYVSPAKGGGFCFEWTGSTGSCEKLTSSLFSLAWGRPHVVIGTVSSPQISSVKIRFTDGTTVRPSVSWVAAPINAGFFLYDIPRGKAVATIDYGPADQ